MTYYDFNQEIDRREVPALKPHPMVLGEDGAHLFPAGVADMDFKAPPAVLDAMRKRLAHGVFGYETVPDGLLPALARWLQTRHGWHVDEAHILPAPNVLNALAIATALFTERGDGIIVQPPVFFDFFDIVKENGRRLLGNPLIERNGHYVMDTEGLEQLAADPRTRLLLLCNPHNPVGRVWHREELERVATICCRNDVLVVADEIHGDITFPGHPYTPFASLGEEAALNSIVCLSPAKSFNIAACCSAFTLVTDDKRRAAFQAENSRLTVNKNNAFASVAMEAAYRDGGPWLDAVIQYISANLSMVRECVAGLPGVNLIEPEGTFMVWLDFRGLSMGSEVLTAFLRKRVHWGVTRGPAFGTQGVGFARLNIACTRARLSGALSRLEAALQSLR